MEPPAASASERLITEDEDADKPSSTAEARSTSNSEMGRRSTSLRDVLASPTASLRDLTLVLRQTRFLQGRRVALGAAIMNVMNCIMGSGILALPNVMSENGVVLYVVLQLLMMLAVDFSLHLLVAASAAQRVTSYEELGDKAYGFRGKLAVCLSIFVNNNASILSYLIVVGDLAPTLMLQFTGGRVGMRDSRTFLMTILTCAVIAPLSVASSTRIGVLGYASFLSFTVMLLLCALAAVEFWKLPCGPRTCQPVVLATPGLGTVLALPTLSFAFVCHTAFLPVLQLVELRPVGRPRPSRPPEASRGSGRSYAPQSAASAAWKLAAAPAAHLSSLPRQGASTFDEQVLRELSEADHIGRSRRPPWRRSVVGHVAIGLAGAMYLQTAGSKCRPPCLRTPPHRPPWAL